MASYRYRSQIPCQELIKRGVDAKINEGEADTVIFSKPLALDVSIAKQAREQGCRVIVDFCDPHFNHKELGPVYSEISQYANVITCPTKEMQNRILENLKKGSVVIPDPYEVDEKEPHADGESKLWFGHQRNLNEILKFVNYYQTHYQLPLIDFHWYNLVLTYHVHTNFLHFLPQNQETEPSA